MFENIYLEPEQIELICEMVEFIKSIPREQRRKFILAQSNQGDTLFFPGHPDRNRKVYIGDLEELVRQDLIAQSYSSKGTPNFDITALGYRYNDYIKELDENKKMDISQETPPPDLNVNLSEPIRVGDPIPPKPIFLSYAREDHSIIEEFADRLTRDGFRVWLDKRDLLPGDNWKSKIEEAIEKADYVLLFFSSHSVTKTGYVQREFKYAMEQRQMRPSIQRYIIPVLLEDCDPPREFRNIQWFNYWEEGAYEKLKKALIDK